MKNLLYALLKIGVKFTFGLLFSKIEIRGKEHIPEKGPVILVSNHPHTLTDVLLAASNVKTLIVFLANYSLYKTAVSNAFFSFFYTLPIQRKVDVGDAKVDNSATFNRIDEFLGKEKGSIYVAVEGTSIMERKLRRLKTGAARMGLSAEANYDFGLDLKILPLGINYSEFQKSGSTVLLNFGEAITPADYKEKYHSENFGAIREITDNLKERMLPLVLHNDTIEADQVLRKIEALRKTDANNKKDLGALFDQTKIDQANILGESVEERNQFEAKLNAYFDKLTAKNTTDQAVNDTKNGNGNYYWNLLLAVLGFPAFLLGAILHIIPFIIAKLGLKKLKLYPGYDLTFKYVAALFFVPITYIILGFIANNWLHGWQMIAFFIGLFFIGKFAVRYHQWKPCLKPLRQAAKMTQTEKNALMKERTDIISLLDK